MFSYCLNNPINLLDENGRFPVLAIILIGGCALIGGIMGYNSNKNLTTHARTAVQNNTQESQTQKTTVNQNISNGSQNTKSIVEVERSFFSKRSSGTTKTVALTPTKPSDSYPELTTSDRIKNTIIGATLGMAAGGAAVAMLGMSISLGVGVTAVVGGATGAQTFAIGALSYNFFCYRCGPVFWYCS